MFHHFFNAAIGHAFFNTAVGHTYSLNTDIRELSSMVYESYLRRETWKRYSDRKHTGEYVEKRPYLLLQQSATLTARIQRYSLQG